MTLSPIHKCGLIQLLLLFLFSSSIAQKAWTRNDPPPPPFAIPKTFPDAEALILSEGGQLAATRQDGMELLYTVRIVILNESGLSRANIQLPYYAKDQVQLIHSVKARTWNWNGEAYEAVAMKNNALTREKLDDEYSQISFALPQVKVGSVIEYQYEMSKRSVFAYNWVFQSSIPALQSNFQFRFGESLSYQIYYQNGLNVKLKKSGGDRFFQWTMKDIPAKKEEASIDNIDDYSPKLMLQLEAYDAGGYVEEVLKDWSALTDEVYQKKLLGRYLKKDNTLLSVTQNLVQGKETDAEKITAIYEYVQSKVSWNGERAIFAERKITKIHESSEANSAEINILLTHMLRAAGFEAYPMLISTRDHGLIIPEFPLLTQFNSTLCYLKLKDKPFILDAVNPIRPYTLVAEKDLSGKGWVLEKGNGRWAKIPPSPQTNHSIFAQLSITEGGSLKGNVKQTSSGFRALSMRSNILSETPEAFMNAYQSQYFPEGEVNTHKIEGLEELDQPLVVSMDVEMPDFSQQVGEFIYVDPLLMMKWKNNPFQDPKRIFPIDLVYPRINHGSIMIQIPEGYAIESIPKSKSIKLPKDEMMFTYTATKLPNAQAVEIQYQFKVNQTLYSPSQYSMLKDLYDVVMASHNEQIVLKKK